MVELQCKRGHTWTVALDLAVELSKEDGFRDLACQECIAAGHQDMEIWTTTEGGVEMRWGLSVLDKSDPRYKPE
jgi:hypothetical protein